MGRGHGHDLAPCDALQSHELQGLRWPVIDGKETPRRFRESHDPFVTTGTEVEFHAKPGACAAITTSDGRYSAVRMMPSGSC